MIKTRASSLLLAVLAASVILVVTLFVLNQGSPKTQIFTARLSINGDKTYYITYLSVYVDKGNSISNVLAKIPACYYSDSKCISQSVDIANVSTGFLIESGCWKSNVLGNDFSFPISCP